MHCGIFVLKMANVCAASFCKINRYKVTKNNLNVIFHKFPKDNLLQRKLIIFCKKEENWIPKSIK